MLGLTVAGGAFLGLNLFGLFDSAGGLYLIGLFFPLLQSAFYFLHIVTYSEPFEEE